MAFLRQLQVFSFRNIGEAGIRVESPFMCLYGQNAQGKTNILESIYLLSNTRSFRPGGVSDWIMHGKDALQVKAIISDSVSDYEVSYSARKDKRQYCLDGNRQKSIKNILNQLKIISYSPSSFELITGLETEKRRFFDKLAFCLDTSHLDDLVYYNRLLKNRNLALKNGIEYRIWDELLAVTGIRISGRRGKAVEYLGNYLQDTFTGFFEEIKKTEIRTCSNVCEDPAGYMHRLKESRKTDEIKGVTTVGPHRDIFDVIIDGINVKRTLSTGQAKLLAFLFKIAKCRLIKEYSGNKPVFLYDDASIFLDENRFIKLIEIIKKEKIQIIATSVDKTLFNRLFSDTVQLINVDKGSVLDG
ncbi:MAG: DNA replication and repair protein RecF [Oligoflexia bacterium]|nr:DNA replication and repair protein RecF [Oligoflexia bacterium]